MITGTYFSDEQRSLFSYQLWAFILILIGVGVLFGTSMLGGIGGDSGYSG
jgi:Sec-independent protein translocase protein TatA